MIPELLPQEVFEEQEGPKNLYNIAVTVLEAIQVKWQNTPTRLCIKFGKMRKLSRVKESSERPYYNADFVFYYDGSLDSLMDMVLTIAVLHHKPGLRRDKLLASARLDMGAIWTQPGHSIAEKWIVLTHPSDPTGEIEGYLNCEISILPGGEVAPYTEKEPSGKRKMFIPESLGGGRLKARYIFGVHRGEDITLTGKKPVIFIRVFFAGLSGETTKRKNNKFPTWEEEIVFTELFPPMYNRFRIDVHIGKKIVCNKYLNLSSISDPTVNGFLPTYGPSFLYLYSPPYNYLGSILVSLETRTVYALYENEKLLDVRRRRGTKLLEKYLWNHEEFALFGIIYEVSMLRKEVGNQAKISVGLGFGISEQKPESQDNICETWADKTVPMDEMYTCLPMTNTKQTLYTRETLPDNRKRLLIANRLNHIAKEFGQEMIKLQFLLEHSPDHAEKRLNSIMKKLIENCKIFKSAAATGPTKLDEERFKTINAKVDNVINVIEQVLSNDTVLFTKYETGLEVFREVLSIVQDPQESFPQIILTIKTEEDVMAFTKVRPRDVLYSSKSNEKGIYCGVIQSLFLTSTRKRLEDSFGGKIDVLLWFGPYVSIGHGLSSIPSGFQDISQDFTFPKAFVYTEANIKKALSPLWLETLVIKDVLLHGNVQDIKRNPHKIAIEVWNYRKTHKNLVGRFFVKPYVVLKEDKLQPPSYPPPLEWQRICNQGRVKGEILAMFELIQNRESESTEEESRVIELPKYIKPPTKQYRFEILFWGIRTTKAMKLSSLNIPRVIVDCGPIHIESSQMKDVNYFPNFIGPPILAEVELPVNWYFAPPFVVRLFDSQAFGTMAYIGSETKRSLKMYHLVPPNRREWNQLRSSRLISVRSTVLNDELVKLKVFGPKLHTSDDNYDSTEEPLINLKKDARPKDELKVDVWKKLSEDQEEKRWWQRIGFRRKKSDFPGYIPLQMLRPKIYIDSEEQSYDWWTKYFDSKFRKNSENVQGTKNSDNYNHQVHVIRKRTEGIKIYNQELEKEPKFNGFQDVLRTFIMTKTSVSGETAAAFQIKAGIALYEWPTEDLVTPEGYNLEEGIFPALAKELNAVISLIIRVYVVRAYKLHSRNRYGKVDPYIIVSIPSQTISDVKDFIKQDSNPIFGRFYELEGKLPYDSILKVCVMDKGTNELIGETDIDIENRYYSHHRGTCGIQKSYSKTGYDAWRDAYKPSEILDWLCITNNIPEPKYRPTYVIVANRKFSKQKKNIEDNSINIKEELALSVLHKWDKIPIVGRKLLEEHVETRSLYNPQIHNMEQGKLEMWVDILPSRSDLPKPVEIKPRVPENYELRAIVWATQKVKLVEEGLMVAKRHTDIFVKGWLKGKEDVQKTDTHFASLTGEGLFNWRFIFNFAYDREEEMIILDGKSNKIPPILYLQVWDHDRFFSDDYIGSLSIDIRTVQAPSRKLPYSKKFLYLARRQVNMFKVRNIRGWWPFIGPSKTKIETVGMVDLELQLLSADDAERNPAGHGRNEPNKLPDPMRPIVQYTLWIVPFRAIKNYLWRYHKQKIIQCLLVVVFAVFCLIGFYSIPTYTVKKIMHA